MTGADWIDRRGNLHDGQTNRFKKKSAKVAEYYSLSPGARSDGDDEDFFPELHDLGSTSEVLFWTSQPDADIEPDSANKPDAVNELDGVTKPDAVTEPDSVTASVSLYIFASTCIKPLT